MSRVTHKGCILWISGPDAGFNAALAENIRVKLEELGANIQALDPDTEEFFLTGAGAASSSRRAETLYALAKFAKDCQVICVVPAPCPLAQLDATLISPVETFEIYTGEQAAPGAPESPLPKTNVFHAPAATAEESCSGVISFFLKSGVIDDITDFQDSIYRPQNVFEKPGFPRASFPAWKAEGKLSSKGIGILLDDSLSFLGLRKYGYKQRILFIAGLPKSGTNWMQRLLELVPGYHYRPLYSATRAAFFHDVTPLVFEQLPDYAYSVVRLHTRYTPYNFHVITSYVDRFIVMYRDLRDSAVSRYYHVLNEKTHRHHGQYNTVPMEEALTHSIFTTIQEYADWIDRWEKIATAHSDIIIQVRYEDLNRDPAGTTKSVYEFLELPYDDRLMDKVKNSQLRKPRNLGESLEKRDTKRKGIIGDWKNHFTEEHKNLFKASPAGELLVRLGYEKDGDW